MSDWRERLDVERLDRMELEEYAPAAIDNNEPGDRPDFQRDVYHVNEALVERHTPEVWREVKISEGLCPFPGCSGSLDDSFYCSQCGNVSLPKPKAAA